MVPVEAYTVIIRAETLNRLYPGGLEGFAAEWGNRTFCCDGAVARVGIMVDSDVSAFLDQLRDRGLTPTDDEGYRDVAVVSQQSGLDRPCTWLQLGRHPDGFPVAWIAGSDPGQLALPQVGAPRRSGMIQLTPEEMKRRLRFLRIDGMVDVFVDRETGQELYAGRRGAVDEGNTHPDFPGRRLSELYEWGTALVDRYLLPFKEGYAERRTDAAREELSRGCRLLECVTQQCDDGATFFTLGLAYRVLGQHDREYTALKRASELIPDKTGALREFAQTCLHLGHADEAVAAAWKATELDPADLGLRCNLALALMVKGDIDQASRIAADVLHADPADPVSRNVANLLERIRRGETPRPDRLPLPP